MSELWYWRSPAWVIVLLATFVYTVAALRRPVTPRQVTCFVIAAATFVVALASPLAVLSSQYSFSAHMMQHLLLLLIVPLCAILAWPLSEAVATDNFALPSPFGTAAVGWLTSVGAMWFWHVPALCTAAMQNSGIFAIQTCSLVVAGAAFWWPVFRPQLQRRMQPHVAAAYLFAGCVGCSLLGIYITFSPVSVCPLYAAGGGGALELTRLVHEQWGLTHRLDQQLGGLLMWVPACMVYLGAILATLSSWYHVPERADGASRYLAAE
ncbi:MAG TPA: cytochrome c oxidase assembly protein [Tepidisphaeraceae bacterium]